MRPDYFFCLLLVACIANASNDSGEGIGVFSSMAPGAVTGDWQMQTIKDVSPTEFQIVMQAGQPVLQIVASGSAAALVHPVPEASAGSRFLSWHWKVGKHPPSNIQTKQGDDYAARVYVLFARDPAELPWVTRMKMRLAQFVYGIELPAAAICYVWDPNSPENFSVPNAWANTVYMVVAEGGPTVNSWVSESHDVQADYRRLFAAEPPPITGIIVAGDTDNTDTDSIAWIGDLRLSE